MGAAAPVVLPADVSPQVRAPSWCRFAAAAPIVAPIVAAAWSAPTRAAEPPPARCAAVAAAAVAAVAVAPTAGPPLAVVLRPWGPPLP